MTRCFPKTINPYFQLFFPFLVNLFHCHPGPGDGGGGWNVLNIFTSFLSFLFSCATIVYHCQYIKMPLSCTCTYFVPRDDQCCGTLKTTREHFWRLLCHQKSYYKLLAISQNSLSPAWIVMRLSVFRNAFVTLQTSLPQSLLLLLAFLLLND